MILCSGDRFKAVPNEIGALSNIHAIWRTCCDVLQIEDVQFHVSRLGCWKLAIDCRGTVAIFCILLQTFMTKRSTTVACFASSRCCRLRGSAGTRRGAHAGSIFTVHNFQTAHAGSNQVPNKARFTPENMKRVQLTGLHSWSPFLQRGWEVVGTMIPQHCRHWRGGRVTKRFNPNSTRLDRAA